MKKVSRSSANRGVARSSGLRSVRRVRPRFGPDPAPQPIGGRWGRNVPSVRRRRPMGSRVGRGAAAPLRFVFVRRAVARRKAPTRVGRRTPPASTRSGKGPLPGGVRPGGSLAVSAAGSGSEARPAGSARSAGLPWAQPMVDARWESAAIPQGLPEIPRILLEGDGEGSRADCTVPDSTDASAGRRPTAVWLAGCDPWTLLLGWEEVEGATADASSPTAWRLRSVDDPDHPLVEGFLPTDRRFLFLQHPPPAAAHIVEIGARSPSGSWECWAASGPVTLPPSERDSDPSRRGSLQAAGSGLRPGVASDHFERLFSLSSLSTDTAGSESGLRTDPHPPVHGRSAHPSSPPGPDPGVSSGEGFSSPASPSPEGIAGGSRGSWFRVDAEVVIFGSVEPGAQVTLLGRPVSLRPDGSFTIRWALPDGRFEMPLMAVASRGSEVRHATLTLARQTFFQGGVVGHPGTLGLPLPDVIP